MATVGKGLSTWVGFVGAAAFLATPYVGALADASAPLGVPPALWVKLSALLAVVTIIGRMSQAIASTVRDRGVEDVLAGGEDLTDPMPDAATDVPAAVASE